ncbi:MAG: acetyl-coenzyme A synthetase, partial [Gemmatimonadetes bacterium]|nr:acetyl-coenzyme A synthetase [Gemmatimonadota bacterium]
MTEKSHHGEIAELLTEGRVLKPSADFRAQAQYADPEIYARAAADPEGYWADWARQLHWSEPWSKVLEWEPPYAKWFVGGELNACYNCVDRHVFNGLRNKAAIVWE